MSQRQVSNPPQSHAGKRIKRAASMVLLILPTHCFRSSGIASLLEHDARGAVTTSLAPTLDNRLELPPVNLAAVETQHLDPALGTVMLLVRPRDSLPASPFEEVAGPHR